MQRLLNIFACLLLTYSPESAAAAGPVPVVRTNVEPTSATVGQHLKFTVSVAVPEISRLTVRAPFVNEKGSTWTLIGQPKTDDEKIADSDWRRRSEYYITTFEVGDIPVPQVEIIYQPPGNEPVWTQLTTATTVRVHSVLPADTNQHQLNDIKPPVALPVPRWIYWIAGTLVALVVAIVAWMLWRRFGSRIGQLVRPPQALDHWALEQIDALEREKLIEHKKIKELYTRLADVVRVYLGKLYTFNALDLTSYELLQRLGEKLEREPGERLPELKGAEEKLASLMEEADLVKFARYLPEPSKCRHALEKAREIIRLTRYKLDPVTPASQNEPKGPKPEAGSASYTFGATTPPAPPVSTHLPVRNASQGEESR